MDEVRSRGGLEERLNAVLQKKKKKNVIIVLMYEFIFDTYVLVPVQ